jgi:hypothetical protein
MTDTAEIVSDGTGLFVVLNGIKIANRAHPDTPQARQWVSLEPGYRVLDAKYPHRLVIEYQGTVVVL